MIVRNNKDHFVMVEQHHHAVISKEIMENWKYRLFYGKELRKSVEYAIEYHDYGWKQFDKQPFWNDQTSAPYTFTDFPLSPKTIVYTYGVNEVEKNDTYAALLCSEHYTNFLTNETASDAVQFVEQEKERQKRLMHELGLLNKRLFKFHYGLLKLGDSLSLYLCLNEPGVTKEKVHYFFKNGIDLPPHMETFSEKKLLLEWQDETTVTVDPFPFESKMTIQLKQKKVSKDRIKDNGLVDSYMNTPYEEIKFNVIPK